MPLLDKDWSVIDGGCECGPGGAIFEEGGPFETLNDAELEAALIAADAVRNGHGVLIGADGKATELEKTELATHRTLKEIWKNHGGETTPIENFVVGLLYLYEGNLLDAASILKDAQALQGAMDELQGDLEVFARRYRKTLDAAIAAVDTAKTPEGA
ncbi:MAG: hypothetical protein FJW36_24835 [Acidobacteria bacterium]|nr:hypothetical protein [Acidobacteriota bacterium]